MTDRRAGLATRIYVAALALLAYLPTLASAPGRVAGDTKLYLYLDPGRLVSDSVWSWDARQLGGWVPHQNVGYAWPSGPFHALLDALGTPDWVAHRLWIGTLLFVAGTGMWWFARLVGSGPTAAMAAGLVYQTTPFVLPYISRTSALLLPWALLGWIVGVTVLHARRPRAGTLAAFGLLVATTGGLNATAVAMIAPAPLVWFLLERRRRGRASLGRDLGALAGVALVMSAWWIAGLVVQGRFGAAVLSYSEALPSTAATSTAPEILRGLGYWLLYDRNDVVPLTSAGAPYQGHLVVMLAGFAIVLIGLFGLGRVETRVRRGALTTLAIGVVLGVGAAPFDDPSPLWRLAVEHPTSAISLALRSSSRAAPLVVLALALGVGAVVERLVATRRDTAGRVAIGVGTVALCLVNLPALVGGRLVDPVVDRPERLPAAWFQAAELLDREFDSGRTGAVLLVPGIESAAYRWGYTVDPILPGLTKKPLVTRDWLPLGSPPYMDLLYALDDSFQNGTFEPESIAPVARLLGADTVMVVNSHQYERFGTVRPERAHELLGDDPPGLTRRAEFGAPTLNQSPLDATGADGRYRREIAAIPIRPLPEIEIFHVDADPVRMSSDPVIFYGDGTGLVDAAAAAVIDGRDVVLSGFRVDPTTLPSSAVVVTDSNRKRAHHWRSSQEVWGATEPESGVVTNDDLFDRRLPVFPSDDPDQQTIVLAESVEAVATGYGTALSYWPEYRPSAALDGDPRTSWIVEDDGQVLSIVSSDRTIDRLELVRPSLASSRVVSRIEIRVDGERWTSVDVEETADETTGQVVVLERPGRRVDIRLAASAATDTPTERSLLGFAEVLPTELRRPDTMRVPRLPAGVVAPVTWVFTRLTSDPYDEWRQDPELSLRREFDVVSARASSLRGVGRSSEPIGVGDTCRDDLVTMDGVAIGARVTTSEGTRFEFESCDDLALDPGTHRLVGSGDDSVVVDRVIIGDPIRSMARPVADVRTHRGSREFSAIDCPAGCWLETAEGWNTGWRIEGFDPPIASASGRNTWWIESPPTTTLVSHWTPQRIMWLGIAVSGAGVVACLTVCAVALIRRRRTPFPVTTPQAASAEPRRPIGLTDRGLLVTATVLTALAVQPQWAALPLVVGLAALGSRRIGIVRVFRLGGLALVALSFAFVIAQQIRTGADPSFGWPSVFRRAHRPALLGVILLAVSVWSRDSTDRVPTS